MFKKTVLVLLITALTVAGFWIKDQYFSEPKPLTQTKFMMDTIIEITAYGDRAQTAEEKAFAEIQRLHRMFDRFSADSEVAKVNAAAGIGPVKVSRDMLICINRSRVLSAKLDNVFDISIGPLTSLWGIGRKGDYVPEANQIKQLLPLVDFRKVIIDEQKQTVFLTSKGMQLDFGGVAKGYACDRAIEILRKSGVDSALVNAGGDVRVIGRRPDGKFWNVGIQNPRKADSMIATLQLDSWDTMETSGDYQRYIEKNGNRYSHILDPRTGWQPHEVAAVTIVGNSSLDDDILSTALFILGIERGKELLRQFPGTEAVFTRTDGKTVITDGLKGKLKFVEDNQR